MGNFEKLSVLVIGVIILMILIVAVSTWTDNPGEEGTELAAVDATGGGGTGSGDLASSGFESGGMTPFPNESGSASSGATLGSGGLGDWPDDPLPTPGTGGEIGGDDPLGPRMGEAPKDPDPITEVVEPTPADTATWTYKVKKGDSLSVISQRELGTMHRQDEIVALNPGLNPDRLRIDQALTMPPRQAAQPRRGNTPAVVSGGAGSPAPAQPGGFSRAGDEWAEFRSGRGSVNIAPRQPAVGGGAAGTAPAGPVSATPTPGSWYVTRAGDRLQDVSKRAYGNMLRWPELYTKNLSVISDPDRIPAGTRIFIPR